MISTRHAFDSLSVPDDDPDDASEKAAQDEPELRVSRQHLLITVVSAVTAAVFGIGLLVSASYGVAALMVAIVAAQALLITAWVFAARPVSLVNFVVTTAVIAGGADLAAAYTSHANYVAFAFVLAAGFGLVIVSQLARGEDRRHPTVAMGQQLAGAVAMIALAAGPLLARVFGGVSLVSSTMFATGLALAAAHLTDIGLRRPSVDRLILRGFFGLALGAIVGIVTGAISLSSLVDSPAGDSPYADLGGVGVGALGAITGGFAALVGLILDVSASYGTAELAVDADSSHWRTIFAQAIFAPLCGLCAAAPVGYLIGPILLNW